MAQHKLRLVAVCGSLQRPSRTLEVVRAVIGQIEAVMPVSVQVIELAEVGPGLAGVLTRSAAHSPISDVLEAVENADILIAASPVYRASYTGLFKHLFDLVDHNALRGKPVLLIATGGSDRHSLVIDHQLRPLFSFFQAHTLPFGLYASETDFNGYSLNSPALIERISRSISPLKQLLSVA